MPLLLSLLREYCVWSFNVPWGSETITEKEKKKKDVFPSLFQHTQPN